MSDFWEWIADLLRRLRDLFGGLFAWLADAIGRLLRALFTNSSYNNDKYSDDWRWDERRKRWIYKKSEGDGHKSYQCTEYVIARILGRRARWGGDEAGTVEMEEIIAELAELGWIQREEGCNCGCGEGQSKDCVVVYLTGDGSVEHAAIFDHVRCDWGGKLNPGLPIGRYRRPEDWYPGGQLPNDGSRILYFCPRRAGEAGGPPGIVPQPGTQKTDEQMHDEAKPQ